MRDPRDQPLNVKISNGLVQITIGVDVLTDALVGHLEDRAYINDGDYVLKSPDQLLWDTVEELKREEEDGSTPVHRMFEAAAIEAAEQGTEAIVAVEDLK